MLQRCKSSSQVLSNVLQELDNKPQQMHRSTFRRVLCTILAESLLAANETRRVATIMSLRDAKRSLDTLTNNRFSVVAEEDETDVVEVKFGA